jgi:hypothetical protein
MGARIVRLRTAEDTAPDAMYSVAAEGLVVLSLKNL